MKKEIQRQINEQAMEIWEEVCKEIPSHGIGYNEGRKLRSCQARVYTTEHFYVLVSYRSIIAAIRRSDDVLVDMLRYEYGYTSTSAQHIAKFAHDYGAGTWGCRECITWREV